MNCPQTLQGGNTYYNPLIEGEIESENVEQGNCVSRVGAPMHIRKKWAFEVERDMLHHNFWTVHNKSISLCTDASKNPWFTFEFFFNMAATSSMNLSSPSSGTMTSLPPYTLNFRFSPLKVFHLWAALRLLTVRSGVRPEEFQWRTPVKPTSHFSPHDWAGNHLPFSMTCEEYFCLSQEGRWGSATPNAVIKGHLSVSSWWFSVAQEICHVFLPWKTIPRTQKSGTIHCIKNPSAENSLHFPNTQNFNVKQIREINMQNKT